MSKKHENYKYFRSLVFLNVIYYLKKMVPEKQFSVVLVGIIVFKEDLSLANKIGITLGILSIFLMEI